MGIHLVVRGRAICREIFATDWPLERLYARRIWHQSDPDTSAPLTEAGEKAALHAVRSLPGPFIEHIKANVGSMWRRADYHPGLSSARNCWGRLEVTHDATTLRRLHWKRC